MGSIIGSPDGMTRMLDFCRRQQVRPVIETMPMSKANEAMEKLRRNDARFRMVLQMDI